MCRSRGRPEWSTHTQLHAITTCRASGAITDLFHGLASKWFEKVNFCITLFSFLFLFYFSCRNVEMIIVSRLYPTPLPRPISIQYSVTWRPTSSLSPCDTTIHLFALGPISVFVSRYTWYECAAGREKQSQNLIEKTYSWTCCTTAMTCQGPRIHLSGPATWKWALLGTTLEKKKRRRRNEERAWQKEETKDENEKWRKMHRLIKKTIELFYMDTF